MKKIIIISTLCALLLGAAFIYYPPLRLYLPFYPEMRIKAILLLRNPLCSFSSASRNLSLLTCPYTKFKLLSEKMFFRTRDSDGYEYWESPLGFFWLPPGFTKSGLLWVLAEMDCLVYGKPEQDGVHTGDVVLDCGAHIGTYTRSALNAGAKLVVAIEPAPDKIICLQRSFAREIAEGRVIVYGKGVWDRDEILTFYVSHSQKYSGFDSFIPDKDQQTEFQESELKIPVTTIDRIVSELNLPQVDFIKMDIEGSEQKALLGAQGTIKRCKPRMAIATEHTQNIFLNAQKVSEIVNSIYPGYQTECGQCKINDNRYLEPFVLLFH